MVSGHTGLIPDLSHGTYLHPPVPPQPPQAAGLAPWLRGTHTPALPRSGFDSESAELFFREKVLRVGGVGAAIVGCRRI